MISLSALTLLSLLAAGPLLHSEQAFCPERSTDALCISRDGSRLAVGCWEVWDIATRKRLSNGETHAGSMLALSPDGKYLVAGGNYSEFFIHEATTGKLHWNLTLSGHGDTILSRAEFTADGKFLVTGSSNGILRVWDVRTRTAKAMFLFPASTWYNKESQADYLKVRKMLAAKVKLPDEGVKTIAIKHQVRSLYGFSLSPDSKSVALIIAANEVLVMDLTSGKPLKMLKTDQKWTMHVKFSPDGKMLAVGGGRGLDDEGNGDIELWDVVKGKRIRTLTGHSYGVRRMDFSPDGKLLASGGSTDGVRVWEVATGKQMYRLHEDQETKVPDSPLPMDGVAFLPNGKALLTLPRTADGSSAPVHFWEPATGKRIPQPLGK